MMLPEQIELIRHSWAQLSGSSAQTVAPLFYSRLFELDPSLWLLFRDDIRQLNLKLLNLLHLVTGKLETLEELAPLAQELGQKWIANGVQPADYETARQALFWALAQELGERFTPEVDQAWNELWFQLVQLIDLFTDRR